MLEALVMVLFLAVVVLFVLLWKVQKTFVHKQYVETVIEESNYRLAMSFDRSMDTLRDQLKGIEVTSSYQEDRISELGCAQDRLKFNLGLVATTLELLETFEKLECAEKLGPRLKSMYPRNSGSYDAMLQSLATDLD